MNDLLGNQVDSSFMNINTAMPQIQSGKLRPLVITSGERWRVLTVATAGLQSQYNAQWTLVMAATTVAIVPLVVLFAMFQRHIVRSIVVTGLK